MKSPDSLPWNHLHHGVNTEYDGAKVLGGDADLDGLDDGESEGHTPEDTTSRAEIVQGRYTKSWCCDVLSMFVLSK